MVSAFVLMVVVVALALVFDYINGFHDTANAVATVISTNVLPARTAIMLAAIANFVGAFAGLEVAKTIGSGITKPENTTQLVVVAALISAIFWNLFTWYYGIPSSSSHAIIGGVIGSVWAHEVLDHGVSGGKALHELLTAPGVVKAAIALVASPIVGVLVGFFLMVSLLWIVKSWRPYTVNGVFRWAQLVSATSMAFTHGQNDAQKAMGIITLSLLSFYSLDPSSCPTWLKLGEWQANHVMVPPTWVIVACATSMALGTASGGHRIIKTMGHKIIKLRPINGFAAETAAAAVISVATSVGAPVSTTHVISSAIMGVGASKRVSAVRWGVAKNMVIAWVLTIPITMFLAGLLYAVFYFLGGHK